MLRHQSRNESSKPIYVNYGYPALGVSYNPTGVEALEGAAYFIADNLAPRFEKLYAVDPVSVSSFFQPILPEMNVIDVPLWQFGETTLEQAVTLIAESGASSNDLLYVASPNCAQIVEALGVLELAPTVVAAGGCDSITEEGWYHVNLSWNPSDPESD